MKKLIFSISFLLMIISISTTTLALCDSQCNAQGYSSGICRSVSTGLLSAPTQFSLISNPRDTPSSDHNVFHTHNDLITMFKTLYDKYPGYASYEPIGKTTEGRDIVLFKIGNPNGGKILWDGAMHGWEDAGSEIEYLIAKWLLENGTTGIDPTAKRIIEHNLVLFVPVVNMDSYERQNRNFTSCSYGVDLNRNFVKGRNNASCDSLHYPGPSGASEKETKAIRSVFQTYKPKFYVNVHYGGGPTLYYYTGTPSNYTLSTSILTRINQLSSQTGVTPYPTGQVGASGQAVGDASDYASAWLLEVIGDRTGCSCYSHTCDTYNDMINIYYPKVLPIFLAMTEASGVVSTPSTCQLGETSIGQDDCSSGNLCCCSGVTQKCSDGTSYGQCSSTKPKYCSSGTLINSCSVCGCPSGQSCNATTNACYTPVTSICSDGTAYGSCSATKPKYCSSGTLINKCSQCGCSSGTCQADGTCAITTSNLVGYWKFDGNLGTSTLDSSGFNNNGVFYGETLNNGILGDGTCTSGTGSCPKRVAGYFGNALQFDGVNDYVSVPDSNDLGLTTNLTITAWIYPVDWGQNGMGRIADKNNSYLFYVYNSGGLTKSLSFYYWNSTSTNQAFSNNNVLAQNAWQHVAVTYDGVYVKFYVNGILVSQSLKNSGALAVSSSGLYLGNRNSFDRTFNGTIDEVRTFSRTLTQAEINSEMQSSIPTTSPVASWSFEESGNFVNDTHNRVKGKLNSALSFDGKDDYFRVKDGNSLDMTNSITLSAWIYPRSWSSSYPRIISKEVSITANPYSLELDSSNGRALFCLNTGTGENCIDSGVNSISLSQWYYIVGTWDGKYSRIYLNGALKNSIALSGIMNATSSDILIGNNPSNNRQFDGIIDEVKIYNIPLTSSDISSAYNSVGAFILPYVLNVEPAATVAFLSLVAVEIVVLALIIRKLIKKPSKKKR